MRICPHLSAAAAVALWMAGCADLAWHKPGTTQATLDQELGQCRQDARLQANRELLPTLTAPLMTGADPQGRPIVVQSQQHDAERLLLEQDLTRRCMRGKGYELKPHE
jgi:hypothetical protein